MKRALSVAFFFEFGFALVIVPWSAFWDRNYFADMVPLLHQVITNNFVRGAVSGLGLVNLCAGLGEVAGLLLGRGLNDPASSFSPAPLTKE